MISNCIAPESGSVQPCCLPVELWPLAAQHLHLLSMSQFQVTRASRHGLCVSFPMQRFHLVQSCCIGSIVSASIRSSLSFCLLRMLAFLLHGILVLPDKLRTGDTNPIRIKQYEFSLLDETFVFPAKQVIADDKHVLRMNWNMSRSHIAAWRSSSA